MLLEDQLAHLKRNFHTRLAERRGLSFKKDDIDFQKLQMSDRQIQDYAQTLSFWRKINPFKNIA